MGFPVTYSTKYPGFEFQIFRLDAENQGWSALKLEGNQWIQVSSSDKKQWIGVVTQGRHNAHQWVTSYKVEYSDDGVNWGEVDDGRIFNGNTDMNTHVKHWFRTPVTARSIRISPKSWYAWISLRFDFIFSCSWFYLCRSLIFTLIYQDFYFHSKGFICLNWLFIRNLSLSSITSNFLIWAFDVPSHLSLRQHRFTKCDYGR